MGSFFEAYELCIDGSGTFMSRKSGPQGLNQANSITPYIKNTWFHLVCSIDNSFVKLYVNGQLEASTSSTYNGFDYVGGKKVYIGATNEFYDAPFTGIIDNLRFYNRSITAAEVQALYTQDPACVQQPPPVAQFVFPGKTVCLMEPVNFLNTSLNNPGSYTWTSQPAAVVQSLAGSTNFSYKFGAPGIYTVTLIASNASGVSAPYSQTVAVSACTGIDNVEKKDPLIFPNPAHTILSIQHEGLLEINLRNALGELVQRQTEPT